MDAPATPRITGTFSDIYSTDPDNPNATTIVEGGSGPNGPVADSDVVKSMLENHLHNPGGFGYTDSSCPVCFGSGYIGGFNVFRGWRTVLVPYEPSALLPPEATLELQDKPASVECTECSWVNVRLPLGVVSVDRIQVFHDDRPVPGSQLHVDGVPITSDAQFLGFCDGRPHLLRVSLTETGRISHLEIQLNQSEQSANFELPRQTKNSNMGLLERTDPFQVVFSPLISLVKAQDIVVESVTGRILQVKGCTSWNDRRATILGWEADVRPTQPQEI
jgi:hypothetical protein